DHRVDLLDGGVRDLRGDLAGRRIRHRPVGSRGAFGGLPAEPVVDDLRHDRELLTHGASSGRDAPGVQLACRAPRPPCRALASPRPGTFASPPVRPGGAPDTVSPVAVLV